jgi:DNA polymerase I-like protein with 3'-5' exonuclease and polymerase domains
MFTRGEFTINGVTYGAILKHTKIATEAILITSGTVVSAYKIIDEDSYSYNNVRAKELVQLVLSGVKSCTSKNCTPQPFALGAMNSHEFIKNKKEFTIQLHRGEVVGAYINSADTRVELSYMDATEVNPIPDNIPYVKLTKVRKDIEISESELDAVQTRSVQEIALEKEDVSWFRNKKYYVVKDDETAEKIFAALDNYNGPIAYDTETTGLKINCFGMINSEYQKSLIEYNKENKENPIRADKLVGIIFCIEENTSYYFPCANRKFKNLYEQRDSQYRNKIISNTKARYTVGDMRDRKDCVAEYWRNTSADDITEDCVLMERVRDILEKKHIVAHNGSFEYKVGMQYNIDTNLEDDTMIMHQVVYKFRNGGRAEPSNLKHLSKVELGIDQWELHDFFPNWKPDKDGLVRRKPGSKLTTANQIDFSYMDEQGTRCYAPTDGDCTLGLFHKFKTDMIKNHKDQLYIYSVEVLVACAIGYMEFYGHKIDEAKIMGARAATLAEKSLIESEVREAIGQNYRGEKEVTAYNNLKTFIENKKSSGLSDEEYDKQLIVLTELLDNAIAEDKEHLINLGSSAQVCDLFYNKMEIPMEGDKPSVAKKPLKALMKAKNEDGTNKYPIVHLYSEYKGKETLLSKFFDNLIYFMYPGGFIFSSFGQIATNTGRMSCKQPNAQQYPKVIAKIIIPRKDCITLDADYSQIEYRVITALAKNDWLAELFSNPDSDYHTLMASLMYGVDYSAVTGAMRSAAKSFNFGIPYGMGLGSLAILLTGKNTPQTRQEAAEKQADYFRNQPRTKQFLDSVKEQAEVNGYTTTQFCRYRYYNFTDKDGNTNHGIRAAALRQAGNAVIQGCISGKTMIQTKEYGLTKIKDVVNYSGEVWNGTKWTHGDVLYSGRKQKCIITFTNEKKFICSPIHKFSLLNNEVEKERISEISKDNKKFVECQKLKIGDTVENEKNSSSIVRSVEITDEYIDMYDVCNTDDGYYVADGLITHNTAADIFKIGVARNFSFIRRNKLFGKLFIINMIHDEQLMEINYKELNVQRVLTEVGKNMQFKIDGYPPLFIGAGIGKAWGYAKGKAEEIHPTLLEQYTKEAENIPLYRTDEQKANEPEPTLDSVYNYFHKRVVDFREQKVYDYLSDRNNWHKIIHPAISGLINLQFNYGRGDDAKAYVGPNGEKYSDQEFLELNIDDFLKEHNIPAKPDWFRANDNKAEDEEVDKEYSDDDTDELDDILDAVEGDEEVKTFKLVDDSDKTYGATTRDMIDTFGACLLRKQRICGVNIKDMYFRKRNALIDELANFECNKSEDNEYLIDDNSYQLVFLNDANQLNYTGVWLHNINPDRLDRIYRLNNYSETDYTKGDVKTRSQAK